MPEVVDWLKTLGMSEYAERFAESDIDTSVLCELTDQDLKELGVSLGHRRKMLRAIAELVAVPPTQLQPALTEPKPKDTAERRQVTVMFSDCTARSRLWVLCPTLRVICGSTSMALTVPTVRRRGAGWRRAGTDPIPSRPHSRAKRVSRCSLGLQSSNATEIACTPCSPRTG